MWWRNKGLSRLYMVDSLSDLEECAVACKDVSMQPRLAISVNYVRQAPEPAYWGATSMCFFGSWEGLKSVFLQPGSHEAYD